MLMCVAPVPGGEPPSTADQGEAAPHRPPGGGLHRRLGAGGGYHPYNNPSRATHGDESLAPPARVLHPDGLGALLLVLVRHAAVPVIPGSTWCTSLEMWRLMHAGSVRDHFS